VPGHSRAYTDSSAASMTIQGTTAGEQWVARGTGVLRELYMRFCTDKRRTRYDGSDHPDDGLPLDLRATHRGMHGCERWLSVTARELVGAMNSLASEIQTQEVKKIYSTKGDLDECTQA
jgi:hypothetical protein